MNRKAFLLSTITGSMAACAQNSVRAEAITPISVSILASEILPPDAALFPEPIRLLTMPPRFPHISVAIRNTSGSPVRIWTDRCGVGCTNLTFELLAVDDTPLPKPIQLLRGGLQFGGNVPSWTLLAPGEMALREAEIHQGPEPPNGRQGWMYWDFPRITEEAGVTVQLRAIYEIQPNGDTRAHDVWTGRVVSPTQRYLIRMI